MHVQVFTCISSHSFEGGSSAQAFYRLLHHLLITEFVMIIRKSNAFICVITFGAQLMLMLVVKVFDIKDNSGQRVNE